MITTDFVPGSPSWIDLGAPDVQAAARFYGAVFGWDFESMGEEAGDYGFLRKDGKAVGAIGRLTEEGAKPAWMVYFHTDNVDATVQQTEKAGGTVRTPATDAMGAGKFAQLSDAQGAQFAVWEPNTMPGLEAADEPGSLCWVELMTTDAEGAKAFYGDLFGWQTTAFPLPGAEGMTYWMITPAGQPEERMHGGLMEMSAKDLPLTGGRPYWHPVFATADCDATVAKVTGNGGTINMGPEDAEGVGRLAVCVDPSGAEFVVLTPAPM
ncbi:VOC family protein [Streptomyces apocyni]|uniref:VOC family protein n=1 Tax=Streptomyces apocyni TaxID=2654677 RepID=UPI0012EA4C50|nr:VOC family protein [Streptomyces apocyni]